MVKTNKKSNRDFLVGVLTGLPKAPKALPDFSGKGQFFSPDLVIALIVFVTILAFFFVSSHAMSFQIDLYYTKNELEEVSHAVVNPLVLFSGEPYNWETKSFSD